MKANLGVFSDVPYVYDMQEGESGVECGLRKGKTNHTIGCGCGCGCECGCGCGCVCGRDYVHPALGLAKIVPVNNWSERQPFHTCPLGFHFFLSISLILNKRFKPLTSRYRVSFLINPLSRARSLSLLQREPANTGEYRRGGMILASPLYQGERRSGWDPETSRERISDWGGPDGLGQLCAAERRATRPNGEWI